MTVSERIPFSGLLLPLQEGYTYSCDRRTTDGMELLFILNCRMKWMCCWIWKRKALRISMLWRKPQMRFPRMISKSWALW